MKAMTLKTSSSHIDRMQIPSIVSDAVLRKNSDMVRRASQASRIQARGTPVFHKVNGREEIGL